MKMIRQGDVLLVPVSSIPTGCKEVPLSGGRIVLAFGEVTGHAHAITDWQTAGKIAKGALSASRIRARLLEAKDGTRYLEVTEPVHLLHEEHTAHEIAPGFYEIPQQCEHTTGRMVRRVAD